MHARRRIARGVGVLAVSPGRKLAALSPCLCARRNGLLGDRCHRDATRRDGVSAPPLQTPRHTCACACAPRPATAQSVKPRARPGDGYHHLGPAPGPSRAEQMMRLPSKPGINRGKGSVRRVCSLFSYFSRLVSRLASRCTVDVVLPVVVALTGCIHRGLGLIAD